MKDTLCRSCGAPILWAKLIDNRPGKTSKPHPFDPEPNERGYYYLYAPGGNVAKLEARYIQRGEEWPPGAKHRISHFATCPNAEEHRSQRKARGQQVGLGLPKDEETPV